MINYITILSIKICLRYIIYVFLPAILNLIFVLNFNLSLLITSILDFNQYFMNIILIYSFLVTLVLTSKINDAIQIEMIEIVMVDDNE